MVIMQVGDDHGVEPRHVMARQRGRDGAGGTRVDEHHVGAISDEDGIPLANVEHRDAWGHEHIEAQGERDKGHEQCRAPHA